MTDLEYVKKIEELENREKNVAAKQAENEKKIENKKEADRISEQIKSSIRQGL